jgi:hypothetical protein
MIRLVKKERRAASRAAFLHICLGPQEARGRRLSEP